MLVISHDARLPWVVSPLLLLLHWHRDADASDVDEDDDTSSSSIDEMST